MKEEKMLKLICYLHREDYQYIDPVLMMSTTRRPVNLCSDQ